MDVKPAKADTTKTRPLLVCLLPVRNGEHLLPSYLESAKLFADAVVALDDGSTDFSRQILESHPLVAEVLTNPPRLSYLGWDDNLNRNRLLEAASQLNPHWILQLDADERLDASDAEALVDFLKREAQPGYGYCLQSYRMAEEERFEPMAWNNYRLFAYEPGQRLENARLAGHQIPTSIPPGRWYITSLRIKHYHNLNEGHRQRLQKYREADPQGIFATWYENLPPAMPKPYPKWQPRDRRWPYVVGRAQGRSTAAGSPPERLAILREELAASKAYSTFTREAVANLLAALDFEKALSKQLTLALQAANEYRKTGQNFEQVRRAFQIAMATYNRSRGVANDAPPPSK